jgi:hypothetical protein
MPGLFDCKVVGGRIATLDVAYADSDELRVTTFELKERRLRRNK